MAGGLRSLGRASIIVALALWVGLPLVWMLVTSLKPPGTELRVPIEYLPSSPSLENYATVLGPRFTILQSLGNSFFVSSMAMIGTLVLSSMAAFAIARLRFRYRVSSLVVLQLGGMVPPITVLGPTFVMMRSLGLVQTTWGLILPNMAYGIPLAVFLLAAYMRTLPRELDDAAAVDGASSWSEFILASVVSLGSPGAQTFPVAIQGLSRAFQLQWA